MIEIFFPTGTKKRYYYDKILEALRIIQREGWRNFWRQLKNKILENLRIIQREGWGNFWRQLKNYKGSKKYKAILAKKPEKIEKSGTFLELSMKSKLLYFLSQPNLKLSFPKFKKPIVSIIILTFNQAKFTKQCLESILAHTNIPYELIIVDNGSTDETCSLIDRLENVIFIKNSENLGFIKGCNQGARKAKGKYLQFLNNDIIVTPGWLSNLVRTIKNYPKCGAVGCKLIWPNGKLQEAGSIIWRNGATSGYGRGDAPMNPLYSYIREVDYCSGACLLVRKDLFQLLGGFDTRYVPDYYEDSDLCLGIWNLGYKVVFQPNTTIFHHEFISSSFDRAKVRMRDNRSKFTLKWSKILKNKLYPTSTNFFYARDLRQGNKILFLDDRIPSLYGGFGYNRSNQILKFLGKSDYKITFFPLINPTPSQPTTSEFQQMGIEVFYGDKLNFIKFAESRMNYYDLIIVSRPHNLKKTYNTIKNYFPNAILIYDAEALFTMRWILRAKVEGTKKIWPNLIGLFKLIVDENLTKTEEIEGNLENILNILENEEINLIKKADLVIMVSENEQKFIMDRKNLDNIFIWGHSINVKKPKNTFQERNDILFVGAFSGTDSPNENAILYFTQEIFPKIQKELSCRLFIVGIDPPEKVKALASSSIIITGFVNNLEEYYEKCRIFIIPHRYASGIPWKLHEAMSYGIPCVVSELIGSQLHLKDNKELLIAKNPEEFIQKVIKLYQNEDLWNKIQKNAIKYIKKVCNPVKMQKELNKIIKKAKNLKN